MNPRRGASLQADAPFPLAGQRLVGRLDIPSEPGQSFVDVVPLRPYDLRRQNLNFLRQVISAGPKHFPRRLTRLRAIRAAPHHARVSKPKSCILPSAKYSCEASPDMLASGRTAILRMTSSAAVVDVGDRSFLGQALSLAFGAAGGESPCSPASQISTASSKPLRMYGP